MDEPRTFAERLDASKDGKEFHNVLKDLFSALEEATTEDDRG